MSNAHTNHQHGFKGMVLPTTKIRKRKNKAKVNARKDAIRATRVA